MKAILISDHAKWCALMMNGDKKLEVRTSKALAKAIQKLIDENGYADIYVYCSKDTDVLLHCYLDNKDIGYKTFHKNSKNQYWVNNACYDDAYKLNGKVLFKFRCYKVEKIDCTGFYEDLSFDKGREIESYNTNTLTEEELLQKSCLTEEEMHDYFDKECNRYAIHIFNLEIFDRPKELGEFKVSKKVHKCDTCILDPLCVGICAKETYSTIKTSLTKAPQNYMFIEV